MWLGLVIHGWLGYWLDPHVHHVDQWCIPSNEPCPCWRSIFPSWRISCAAAGCAKPTEYVASVLLESCCKWECHPDKPLQKYWWLVARYHPSSSWNWLEHFSSQRAWPIIRKDLPLTWRRYSIHIFVLSRPGGSHTLDQSYWIIWLLWSVQGGRQLGELDIGSRVWFYSGPGNQCRVTRSHISFAPTWFGSHKEMTWEVCAPCRVVIGSSSWSPHFLTENGGRLAHWVAVCVGSNRWDAWPESVEVPR